MGRVVVLTVSCRTGWEELAKEQLAKQTFQDFDWIIVSEQDISLPYIAAPVKTRNSNLNASLNEGLRHCLDADYVIFYQDFIELPSDCFEKLLALAGPTTFVTTLTSNPAGVEPDPRAVVGEPPRECRAEQWEANVSLAPMNILHYLGGFDEEYDNGWSWDNCNVAVRATMLGCRFMIDPTNNPQLIPHNRIEKENNLQLNGEFHQKRMSDIANGEYPLRLPYLNDINTTNQTKPAPSSSPTL